MIHARSKDSAFASTCDFTDKYIKFSKCFMCVKFCSEFPGVFVPDEEINYEEDVNLPFIKFHH